MIWKIVSRIYERSALCGRRRRIEMEAGKQEILQWFSCFFDERIMFKDVLKRIKMRIG